MTQLLRPLQVSKQVQKYHRRNLFPDSGSITFGVHRTWMYKSSKGLLGQRKNFVCVLNWGRGSSVGFDLILWIFSLL